MKQFLAYIFLLLICLNAGGYLAFFKIEQWRIQAEMDRSQSNIETLVIPLSFFKKNNERNGKEIRWNQKMYDIKSVEIKDKSAIIKAIHDTKEHDLNRQLSKLLNENNETEQSNSKTIVKFLKLEFLKNSLTPNILSFFKTIKYNSHYLCVLEGVSSINSPPPRSV